jgi:Xaa-Pro aminopeptidase
MDLYATRRNRLRRLLAKAKVDSLLVTNFTNVTYLTGFTGDDSYLIVDQDTEVILSDPRYTTQLGEESPGVTLHIRPPGETMLRAIDLEYKKSGRSAKRVGVEGNSMTVGFQDRLKSELTAVEWVTTFGLVEQLREIKDKTEIEAIRRAIHQAQRGIDFFRAVLQPEMTEKDLADELEYRMRRFGAIDRAFASIVAAGPRAALPHAVPTDEPVGRHSSLLIDWGACERLYNSDLTRVLIIGRAPVKFRKIYNLVLEAQLAAIDAVRPGVTGGEVDSVARDIITKAGYGKQFEHGTGHGLGLEVHEGPRVSKGSDRELKPGMVITIEPGIYLPGWGGVRIEDDVLVTRTGHEVLTSHPKEWGDAQIDY